MSVNTKHCSQLVKTLRIVVAVFILLTGHRIISFELSLRKYEKAFLRVKHPENSTRVDAFDLEVK